MGGNQKTFQTFGKNTGGGGKKKKKKLSQARNYSEFIITMEKERCPDLSHLSSFWLTSLTRHSSLSAF